MINMHIGVNLSLKQANVRLGTELNADTMHLLDLIEMTKRLKVSQVNSTYNPLDLLTPITI